MPLKFFDRTLAGTRRDCAAQREREEPSGVRAQGALRITERVLWPFAIGYFTGGRVLVAWCEQREGYRHFRSDRLLDVHTLDERYPRKGADMLREWRSSQV